MKWMACALLAAASASALGQDVSGAYLGATVGNLTYTEEADGLVSQSNFDDSSSTYRLYGGYRLGKRLALELGYSRSDGVADTIDMNVDGVIPVDVSSDFAMTTARALVHFPIGAERLPFVSLSLFAGLGIYNADSDWSGSVDGNQLVAFSGTEDGSTALLGLQVDFPKVSVRGEYEWFDTEASVELWTAGIGVIFRF